MEKPELNVVLSADNLYSQHLGVAIASLLANFKHQKYSLIINILDGGISDENKQKITEISQSYPVRTIYWPIDKRRFEKCPELDFLKLPTYYRLIIPEIMPPSVEKVIYLDSDTCTIGDISELFEVNIGHNIIGAAKEISQDEVLSVWRSFGLSKYFNAGVLLIDLQKWRKEKISERAFAFIEENAKLLRWADQDALNIVCANRWHELDRRFNLQIDRNQKKIRGVNPLTLHYVGKLKPWHYVYTNYYNKYYWQYLKTTPWREYKYPDFSLYNLLNRSAKRIPGIIALRKMLMKFLHIKPRPY